MNETETEVSFVPVLRHRFLMLHFPNFHSMTLRWLPRGPVLRCSYALLSVVLLSSGELGAWQEELPSGLSESPIQSQRVYLPQTTPDK